MKASKVNRSVITRQPDLGSTRSIPIGLLSMGLILGIRRVSIAVVLASAVGCTGMGYGYPDYGYGYGYPRFGYGYPYGYGYPGWYGYGPYYPYGYGGGSRYSNTQRWNAYQWLRNNPGGLSPGQMHWLRRHR